MEREDRIRVRAYDIWIAEGCPTGREREHWERAAAEIDGSRTDGSENAGITSAGDAGSLAAPEETVQATTRPALRAA